MLSYTNLEEPPLQVVKLELEIERQRLEHEMHEQAQSGLQDAQDAILQAAHRGARGEQHVWRLREHMAEWREQQRVQQLDETHNVENQRVQSEIKQAQQKLDSQKWESEGKAQALPKEPGQWEGLEEDLLNVEVELRSKREAERQRLRKEEDRRQEERMKTEIAELEMRLRQWQEKDAQEAERERLKRMQEDMQEADRSAQRRKQLRLQEEEHKREQLRLQRVALEMEMMAFLKDQGERSRQRLELQEQLKYINTEIPLENCLEPHTCRNEQMHSADAELEK
eukprot:gene15287-18087_t